MQRAESATDSTVCACGHVGPVIGEAGNCERCHERYGCTFAADGYHEGDCAEPRGCRWCGRCPLHCMGGCDEDARADAVSSW